MDLLWFGLLLILLGLLPAALLLLASRRGSFFLWAALAGIAGAIAGALLAFVGRGQRVF